MFRERCWNFPECGKETPGIAFPLFHSRSHGLIVPVPVPQLKTITYCSRTVGREFESLEMHFFQLKIRGFLVACEHRLAARRVETQEPLVSHSRFHSRQGALVFPFPFRFPKRRERNPLPHSRQSGITGMVNAERSVAQNILEVA